MARSTDRMSYMSGWLTTFGRRPAPEQAPLDAPLTRGFYVPSFHDNVVIELWGESELVVFHAEHTWPYPNPQLHEERATISAGALQRWHAARGAAWLEDETQRLGLDGMPLLGSHRSAEGCHRFTAWSPDAGTPWHRWFSALRQLAIETLPAGPARGAVLTLGSYLHRDFEDLGGSPRWLRIWSLSAATLARLREHLSHYPTDTPWLIDLREVSFQRTELPGLLALTAPLTATSWCLPRHHQGLPLADIVAQGGLIMIGSTAQ